MSSGTVNVCCNRLCFLEYYSSEQKKKNEQSWLVLRSYIFWSGVSKSWGLLRVFTTSVILCTQTLKLEFTCEPLENAWMGFSFLWDLLLIHVCFSSWSSSCTIRSDRTALPTTIGEYGVCALFYFCMVLFFVHRCTFFPKDRLKSIFGCILVWIIRSKFVFGPTLKLGGLNYYVLAYTLIIWYNATYFALYMYYTYMFCIVFIYIFLNSCM